ncbi:MAG TPA: DUF6496 domain-containing protein [Kofleriaceae bacterium]|nr:DUF6496 domain-containing protein [Kofleriaceae bacterium]
MPQKKTKARAKRKLRRGNAPSIAAGELVREEIEHVREGKHGVRSTKQAIAIGLSKARRAGVPLEPPAPGTAPTSTRKRARRDREIGEGMRTPRRSPKRRAATTAALKREPRKGASRAALSRHAKQTAKRPRKTGRRSRSRARR